MPVLLYFLFKGHDEAEAGGLVRAYRDDPPALQGHVVHFLLDLLHRKGFDPVHVHSVHSCSSGGPFRAALFLVR